MASSEDRPLLLDVNALLALAWPNHQFHALVLARLEQRPGVAVGDVCSDSARFRTPFTLPALPRTASVFHHLIGHQQVTDAYLLGVAEANRATLLTLDRRVAPPGMKRAHFEVLGS